MADKQIIIDGAYVDIIDKPKRYCEGIDCSWCDEKEPCIYKIANELEEQVKRKEQECEELKKVNEEKNELLAKLGCPTVATARMKVLCLQDQLKRTEQKLEKIKKVCNKFIPDHYKILLIINGGVVEE